MYTGMITYGQLKLAELRDKVGLDFAHFTYLKNMCSCCYHPHDMAALYWKGKTRQEKAENKRKGAEKRDYEYILFKNAYNCGGRVTKTDLICKLNRRTDELCNAYVEWNMSDEKLDLTCKLLQEQLGDFYEVIKPLNEDGTVNQNRCIKIRYKVEMESA